MQSQEAARIARHISPDEIREQCTKFLESETFARGQQLRKLLAFMIDNTLLNNHHRTAQTMIARQVLEADDFDSTADSSVRRLAARLRERLRDYYSNEGHEDAIIIIFPKGQPYRLVATRRYSIAAVHPLENRAFQEYQSGRSLWAARTPDCLRAAMDCFR